MNLFPEMPARATDSSDEIASGRASVLAFITESHPSPVNIAYQLITLSTGLLEKAALCWVALSANLPSLTSTPQGHTSSIGKPYTLTQHTKLSSPKL